MKACNYFYRKEMVDLALGMYRMCPDEPEEFRALVTYKGQEGPKSAEVTVPMSQFGQSLAFLRSPRRIEDVKVGGMVSVDAVLEFLDGDGLAMPRCPKVRCVSKNAPEEPTAVDPDADCWWLRVAGEEASSTNLPSREDPTVVVRLKSTGILDVSRCDADGWNSLFSTSVVKNLADAMAQAGCDPEGITINVYSGNWQEAGQWN